MAAKVIEIDIDKIAGESPEELKKRIAETVAETVGSEVAEAIADVIADALEEDVQNHDHIAELANKSWQKNQHAIQIALKMANKRSELSAAEIAETLYACGFLDGYQTKEKECE